MSLFQKSVEKKYLNDLDANLIDEKFADFQLYFGNPEIQENIRNSKEEQFQEGFLRELFVSILGYTLNPQPDFNLTTELKNIANSKKADGAILTRGHDPLSTPCVIAVIELKGTDTTDLDKIETQAFGYKNHHPKCKYVITSNFEKLRFYIQNAVDHLDFDLFNLTREQFSLLWLCLAKDNLLSDLPLKIKESSVLQEENITKKLYADYSKFRQAIFNNLVKNNPEIDKLLLFKKTQKLLDRFLFIFFAEDRLLVPPNSISQIIEKWKDDVDFGDAKPLYETFKKYFHVLNVGRPKSGNRQEIFAYNGGLFVEDEILDHINIDDTILYDHTLKLSQYNFETDVDVNILGHIFEHSLGEIENVQAEIASTDAINKGLQPLVESKSSVQSKRKKDGIFYTPKYITKYIVENTVGKLCEEKRTELGIVDEEYAKGRKNRKKELVKSLDKKLEDYRNWLLTLSILDPACGSGAFLNQALEFLINEHRKIDELRGQLLGGAIIFSDITTDILEKNIYGVDLNEESVEIAKLSLWLRTAQKGRKLNTLSNNIKCGNSLIDAPEVAGEKAFNWQNEFPQVFRKKKKKVWHVTTATHNSRYSQRMFDCHVERGEAEWLDEQDELVITKTVKEIALADKLNILAYNICGDHMHLLLVCEAEELPGIVGKIKSVTAKNRNRERGYTVATRGHAPLADSVTGTGSSAISSHAPLAGSVTGVRGTTQRPLWTQKFGKVEVDTDEYLENAIAYIRNNRVKHGMDDQNKASSLVGMIDEMVCTREHAFRTEYKGGFDVVIGNPPYVRADSPGNTLEFREYLVKSNQFGTLAGKWDLYIPFIEQSIKLARQNGKISLIIPDAYCHADYANKSLEWAKTNQYLFQIDYYPEFLVFQNVGVKSVIVNFQKNQSIEFVQRIHHSENSFSETVLKSYPQSMRIDWKASILENNSKYFLLHQICYSTKGIVGNSDEKKFQGEFEVGDLLSEIKNESHPKLYFEGKDIGKWILLRERWLEYGTERSPSKWSRKGFTEMFEGSQKIVAMRSPGYVPRLMLDENNGYFNESAIGFKRWIDLRNVNNNSLNKAYETEEERFEFERISGLYSYPFLLAILNSSVIRYELNTNRRSNIHIYPEDWKVLRIPKLEDDIKPFASELEKKAELMLSLNKEIRDASQKFQRTIQRKFNLVDLPGKLQNWYLLSFKEFIVELVKKKIKLSLAEEAEWEDYFNEQKEKAQTLKSEIEKTDREIDRMVYALYGLTEEEIKIVENV